MCELSQSFGVNEKLRLWELPVFNEISFVFFNRPKNWTWVSVIVCDTFIYIYICTREWKVIDFWNVMGWLAILAKWSCDKVFWKHIWSACTTNCCCVQGIRLHNVRTYIGTFRSSLTYILSQFVHVYSWSFIFLAHLVVKENE